MPDVVAQIVSASDMERLLACVQASSAVAADGIFGPASVSWKVNRESALLLAAGRAALLQLAHPWVATAIAQHSRTLHDPIGRFHQTFRAMFTIIFAPLEPAIATARQLHYRHAAIRGAMPEAAGPFAQGSPYQANELDALRWVYATLVESAILAYELVLPPLSEPERERYYSESKKTASLFGIPPESLPPDWTSFQRYFQSMLQSEILTITAAGRQMAQDLQAGAGLPVSTPRWYRALTISLLPPRLRDGFHLSYHEREQRSAARALTWIRRVYPRLPSSVRFVGPYNEVQARLRPRLAVRLSNRFWIGADSLYA